MNNAQKLHDTKDFCSRRRKATRFFLAFLTEAAMLEMPRGLQPKPQQSAAPARGEGATLEIVVVDEEGKRLPDVLVAVPAFRSTTSQAGTCRFSLPPGRYSILISKDGYRGRRVSVAIRARQSTPQSVKLQKLPPAPPPKKEFFKT